MKLNYENKKVVRVSDLDNLITETYGRVFSYQQQDGCKSRGIVRITVPCKHPEDYENSTVPENLQTYEMGVSFKAWLERDPDQKLNSKDEWDRENGLKLWWKRNFYPHVDTVLNDLYEKGLIEEGSYLIDIDW